MRPHEEEWEVHPLDSRCVVDKAERVIADIRAPLRENGREVSALIAAAPDMARALLASGYETNGHWHTELCHEMRRDECLSVCAATRAALRKAGVL